MRSDARKRLDAERISSQRDGHWLIWGTLSDDLRDDPTAAFSLRDRDIVVGCACGFVADQDSDCGWGDSVVDHIWNTARGAS